MRPSLTIRVELVCAIAIACTACEHTDPDPIDPPPASRACPTHLDLELIGSESRFDPGFSGSTHGVGLATGSDLTVKINGCDAECRRCTFRGPVRGIKDVVNQRCLNNVSRVCATNGDCPADEGPCRFVFPPITSRLGFPTCSLAYFEPISAPDDAIQGTADLFTGESDMPVLNINIQTTIGECDECAGDPKPFDSLRQGTCVTSGAQCDVNGQGTGIVSQTSYDCAPPPSQGLNIRLPGNGTSTASRRWIIDDTRPMCTAGGMVTTEPCFCGVCMDGTPCIANRDCGTGNCGFPGASPMMAVNVRNNSCMGVCEWNETTQRGRCSENRDKVCFPDGAIGQTLIARGLAEVGDGFFISRLANLVCLPSFKNALIDQIGGFPGPFLFEAAFRVSPRTVEQ